MVLKKIPLILIFLFSAAFGPCDLLDDKDDDDSHTNEGCKDYDIECRHTLKVEFLVAGSEDFYPGLYTFWITAPDLSTYYVDCMLYDFENNFECDDGNTDLMYVTIKSDQRSSATLNVKGAPPYFDMEVYYNDYQVGKRFFEPVYDLSYPNGDGCSPVCYHGSVAMAIMF